jgi:hypothetical protein
MMSAEEQLLQETKTEKTATAEPAIAKNSDVNVQRSTPLPRVLVSSVLSFLTEADFINVSLVSRDFYKETAYHRDDTSKVMLEKILQFKGEDNALVITIRAILANKHLSESTWLYTHAYSTLKHKATVELIDLGYRADIVRAIRPEILWAVPDNVNIPYIRDHLSYFSPGDVPSGMSRAIDPAGRPAIFFKFKYQCDTLIVRQDGSEYNEYNEYETVSVHHARYSSKQYPWVKAGENNHIDPWMQEIEGPQTDQIVGDTYGGADTSLGQILTAYRLSIYSGKSIEPVLVKPKPLSLDDEYRESIRVSL